MALTDRDDVRLRPGWRAGAWTLLALVVLAEVAASVMVDWFVQFGQSSTCGDAPTPGDVQAGRLVLLGVLGVVLVPWLVAAWRRRDVRGRLLVAGVVACLPALLFALSGLRTDFWVGDFCF